MAANACAATAYPRSLPAVLTAAETATLTRLYFDRIRPNYSLKYKMAYYGLLHELSIMPSEDFLETAAILDRIRARIKRELGSGFVVINDFFSYFAPYIKMFPDLHQDYDFWMVDGCAGFNLWVLLDHRGLSFDVYDYHANTAVYDELYRRPPFNKMKTPTRQSSGGGSGGRYNQSATTSNVGLDYAGKDLTAFSELRERNALGGRPATLINVPMQVGDALVLRQPEIHRTERRQIGADQWRLALGFKVLDGRRRIVGQEGLGPASQELLQINARFPGLVPQLVTGQPYPHIYGDNLRVYRASGAAHMSWLQFAAAHAGRHIELVCCLTVPLLICQLMLCVFWVVPGCRQWAAGRRSDHGSLHLNKRAFTASASSTVSKLVRMGMGAIPTVASFLLIFALWTVFVIWLSSRTVRVVHI